MYLHAGIPQSTYCNSGTNYQPIITKYNMHGIYQWKCSTPALVNQPYIPPPSMVLKNWNAVQFVDALTPSYVIQIQYCTKPFSAVVYITACACLVIHCKKEGLF